MMRMSAFTRTDQKFLSWARSSLWNENPGVAGFSWRSNAVVFVAFCSCDVRRARLAVNVSAMRKSIIGPFSRRPGLTSRAWKQFGPWKGSWVSPYQARALGELSLKTFLVAQPERY